MDGVDDEFRARVREVLERAGRSMRGLSAAMGRDPGYVAALLDPSRPSRARPTPADLLRASDASGISFVELLETLWGIDPHRLADELMRLGVARSSDPRLDRLSETERATVADFIEFLAARQARGSGRRPRSRRGPPAIVDGVGEEHVDPHRPIASLPPPEATPRAPEAVPLPSGRVFLGAYRPPSSIETMSDADLDAWAASAADAMAARIRARATDASGPDAPGEDGRSRRRRPGRG